MNVAEKKFPPVMWMASIAVILFCLTAMAAILGWIPSSLSQSADDLPAEKHSAASAASSSAPAKPHKAPAKCSNCGIIESIRTVDAPGESGVMGIAGGAVAGGVLGHQVGGGRGKDIATVVGAVGGAIAGNEIEKRVRASTHYETTVRFDDGSKRVIAEASPSKWQVGDQVKVSEGNIVQR